jgi:peptidoglycan hydrolase-like protein with peptidoglycan-binding domain
MAEYVYPTDYAHTPGDHDGSFDGHLARGSVNPGVDFPVGRGANVRATRAGRVRVVFDSTRGSGGRYVELGLDNGVITQDLHLSEILVTSGEEVEQGEVIALSGGSANGSETGVGDHLHHSHIDKGVRRDFLLVIAGGGSGDGSSAGSAGGYDVGTIQTRLGVHGYPTAIDGSFGPDTIAKLRGFQTAVGVAVDGIVGPITWAKLNETPVTAPTPAPAPAPSSHAVVQRGDESDTVRHLQGVLNRDYPAYSSLTVDGSFGPATEAVVREFQARAGLVVDGVVGSATWGALGE